MVEAKTEKLEIIVESCMGCESHAWYTRHDQNMYNDMNRNLEQQICINEPSAKFHNNTMPSEFENRIGQGIYKDREV